MGVQEHGQVQSAGDKAPDDSHSQDQATHTIKRERLSDWDGAVEDAVSMKDGIKSDSSSARPIQRWVEDGTWSGGKYEEHDNIARLFVRKRSDPSYSEQGSHTRGVSLRGGKEPTVNSQRYDAFLSSAGIYIGQPKMPPTAECQSLCQLLLDTQQATPKDTIFRDDIFGTVCCNLGRRNKARVIQDIGRLLVPSPETLTMFGATQFKYLAETADERWYKATSLLTYRCPHPDFAVGVRPSAFTPKQWKKLRLAIGVLLVTPRLAATDDMYIPFLTVEVQCGNEALRLADRKNAHIAAMTTTAVIELYATVSRQAEFH